jgi:hypothetical protein
MIDQNTGWINLGGISISPALGQSEFQDSELSKKATPMVINMPWASYRIGFEQGDIVLQFKESKLLSISIIFNLPDEKPQEGWEAWSQENEKIRKQLHDQILRDEVGSVSRVFRWGEVGSIADPKTCDASIFIQYK